MNKINFEPQSNITLTLPLDNRPNPVTINPDQTLKNNHNPTPQTCFPGVELRGPWPPGLQKRAPKKGEKAKN